MSTQFPKEIELARSYMFFDEGQEHVPPASHDPVVAELRRNNPAHSLVYRNQLLGALTAQSLFEMLVPDHVPELDKKIGAALIAGPAVGSARLSFEQAPMRNPLRRPMRRNIALPLVADKDNPSFRRPYAQRIGKTYLALEEMVENCTVAYAITRERPITQRASYAVGRSAAEAALWVALLPERTIEQGKPADVQFAVREAGMNALRLTQEIGLQVGARISLAMLAQKDSPLTAYINSSKAHVLYNALMEAQATAPILAARALRPWGLALGA